MRAFVLLLTVLPIMAAPPGDDFRSIVDAQVPALFAIDKDLHAHPEISQHEVHTSTLLAEELPAIPSPGTSASIRTAAPHSALSRF